MVVLMICISVMMLIGKAMEVYAFQYNDRDYVEIDWTNDPKYSHLDSTWIPLDHFLPLMEKLSDQGIFDIKDYNLKEKIQQHC